MTTAHPTLCQQPLPSPFFVLNEREAGATSQPTARVGTSAAYVLFLQDFKGELFRASMTAGQRASLLIIQGLFHGGHVVLTSGLFFFFFTTHRLDGCTSKRTDVYRHM